MIPKYMLDRVKRCIRISVENDGKLFTTKEVMKLFGYSEKSDPWRTIVYLFVSYSIYIHTDNVYNWKVKAKTFTEDSREYSGSFYPSWHYKICNREENKHKIIWYKLIEHGGWL